MVKMCIQEVHLIFDIKELWLAGLCKTLNYDFGQPLIVRIDNFEHIMTYSPKKTSEAASYAIFHRLDVSFTSSKITFKVL